ncbi:MAG: WecB/TagA/CpsF family glycosyltransferase [Firmicutes bacterium]|mgnify:CR=1 FL=1|nr:WecB/TagA/CpsF family glycosyltransferase [Bacillota bacterium]
MAFSKKALLPTVNILGTEIHRLSREHLLQLIEERYEEGIPTWIVTANAEMAVRAKEEAEVADVLAKADLRLADGAGIVWAAKQMGSNVPERLPGVEIAEELVAWAAVNNLTIYMLGAGPGVAEEAVLELQTRYPGLRIVGYHHGYFDEKQELDILDDIRKKKPNLLLVALGAPRQEQWIAQHFPSLNTAIAVGVGGSFDVWAGRVKRAPTWMGERGLEWLYRLIKEPRRAKRMLALPRFVWYIKRESR